MMRLCAGLLAVVALLVAAASTSTAAADEDDAARPKINSFYRWLEDWSALADPNLRTQPLDGLKYIPLPFEDPKSYVSLGLTVRERFELNAATLFGIAGNTSDSYLLDRLQWHVDVRPNAHWQLFVELEDVRAPAKAVITPADENPLDLRLAFFTYVDSFWGGTLKARVGRQEMAFDLQRFVSVRDGPNLRQAYVTNAAPGKGAPAERRQMHDPTIVSDVICAWCFLAKKNLDKALELIDAKLPVEITWRPFELNPTMPKGGIDRREYRSKKFGSWARSQALDAQVAEVGARAGIAFRHDLMARTPNTLQALARSGGDLIRALSDFQSAQLRYGHELHRYGVALGDRWAKAL